MKKGKAEEMENKKVEELPFDMEEELWKLFQKEVIPMKNWTPKELKAKLDETVIGQDPAKKVLSVAISNHMKRIQDDSGRIRKSNLLLIGPSGSGKTLLIQTLAHILDIPMVIVDATTLTQAGYVGNDVESILTRLLMEAGGDLLKAEKGIVFIDEIDKIGQKSTYSVAGSPMGTGVQHALLKLIEGANVQVPLSAGNHNPNQSIILNTKKVLFLCGGAFEELERTRKEKKNLIGFEREGKCTVSIDQSIQESLVEFGLIPEFVGRLNTIVQLKELTKPELVSILKSGKFALMKEYQRILELDGINLVFEEDALEEIAELALRRKIGARGLRSILEEILQETMYQASGGPEKKVIVDQAMVLEQTMGCQVYWSSFLVTLCSEIMLYIETPLVSYSYSLNEVSHSCTS